MVHQSSDNDNVPAKYCYCIGKVLR